MKLLGLAILLTSFSTFAETRICTGGFMDMRYGTSISDGNVDQVSRIMELTYEIDERGLTPKTFIIKKGKSKEVVNSVTFVKTFLNGVPDEAPAIGFKGVIYELGTFKEQELSDLYLIHKDDVKIKLYYPYTETENVFKEPIIRFEQEWGTEFKPVSCKTVKLKN